MMDPWGDYVEPTPSRRWPWISLSVLGVFVLFGFGARAWYRTAYPYGNSHSCSKAVGLALRMYAQDNGNWFPHGGRTPEESLSFVCTNNDDYGARTLLGGKHVPQSVVDTALKNNGVLSPVSCGWHYIEGLREDDNPELAVAWDKKVGLNHNGRLTKDLQCEVILLVGSTLHMSKKDWPAFCAKQKELLAKTIASRDLKDPPIRWSDEEALGPNVMSPRKM